MSSIALYFHVHQPFRIKNYSFFSVGSDSNYYSTKSSKLDNKKILEKVVSKCYLPTNKLLLDLLKQHPDFKVSFSLSGLVIEQLTQYAPEVIDSFKELVNTGKVEILSETYYHSLSSIYSKEEFISQIQLHRKLIKETFAYETTSFRNTELIYNNEIAKTVEDLGFKAVVAEGVDKYLSGRSPNFLYQPKDTKKIKLLLKNYQLSDDIAFRFSDRSWSQWPLTADKFVDWIKTVGKDADTINLFMDYETFGEHQWKETGIFDFLFEFPQQIMQNTDFKFLTVAETATVYKPVDTIDIREFTSWSDTERDVSAWLSNPMQLSAIKTLYELEGDVLETNDDALIQDWRRLTTSDHFYYMSIKESADGQVHKYFSPNENAYEAFTNFMTILHDLRQRVYTKIERN